MRKIYVADIRDRDPVDSVFLVKDKITAMAKNGKPYLTLRLMDKTGEIDAKVWDNIDQLAPLFDKDDVIAVRAKASIYLAKMQLVVTELARVPEERVNLADFLPVTGRDGEEMRQELRDLLATLRDPHLAQLLDGFFGDPAFLDLYAVAPAAKGMHHVCLGGLLEHSLAVTRLVDAVVPLYPGLNRDLLVAGALLHDVGKVRELSFRRSFDYTDEGKLIGHITIGVEMVSEKIAAVPGFPGELAMLLKHLLISHHGEYEFGSPKRPKTLEATVLNYLDDLDSKINGIRTHMNKELEGQRWTAYHRLYDRYFYREAYPEAETSSAAEPGPEPEAAAAGAAEPVAVEPAQPRQQPGRGFRNSPFTQLGDKNLDLF